MKSKLQALAFSAGVFAAGALTAQGRDWLAIVFMSLLLTALGIGYQPGLCRLNTLTNLIPDVYVALDVVSRELTGFILAVARDSNADRIAIGQTARAFQTPANAAGRDIVGAMGFPAAADQVLLNRPVTITKARAFPFSWTGEEQGAIDQGPGFLTVQQNQIAQAIRAAVNEIETDLGVAAALGASRAFGTAGATPFATNLGDPAQVRKILDDNGAPGSDRTLIINTSAGAAIRTLAQLTKANEAGETSLLRQGTLLDIHGFAIKESAKTANTAAGTGASYVINNGPGYAIGATSLVLGTGTGTLLAGDIVTIGNFKYVVATGIAAPGALIIAAPGLQAAVVNGATVTLNATSARNIGLSRNALLLATRLPEIPKEGDLALMRETVVDPRTGLSFEIAVYPGYRMVVYEVSVCWGTALIKPEHMAVLLG